MKDILPELNNKDYIEKLDHDYDIHFCKKNEVEELIKFIDTYWRKNHIFVLSRRLLDWQHYDAVNKRYNFVIARHRETGEIHSILGFVPTYQYDCSIKEIEVWPCIWKSRDDIQVKGLGVALYYYMKSNIEIETISILGISEIALSIYKHWNFSTGKIEQYYYPNHQKDEILSSHRQVNTYVEKNKDGWHVKELLIEEYENINSSDAILGKISKYKSKKYYISRYYEHPMYHYVFYAIYNQNEMSSIMVMRECGEGENKCLRIVDYIGDVKDLMNVRYDLQKMIQDKEYEYVDFVFVGISSKELIAAGFINRKDNPQTIIPHYFEPFIKENVDLDYAFKSVNSEVTALFYKADADQDRPNML